MSGPEWDRFVQEILEEATQIGRWSKSRYYLQTRGGMVEGLRNVDATLTKALECIERLGLLPEEEEPGVWGEANYAMLDLIFLPDDEHDDDGFLAARLSRDFASSMRQFRDVARHAAELGAPARGNAPNRTPDAVLRGKVGARFVTRFVSHFNQLPPESGTLVEEALTAMAAKAGVAMTRTDKKGEHPFNANSLLQASVKAYKEHHEGSMVPTAAEAHRARKEPAKPR